MLALSLMTAPGAETDSALRAHVRPLNDAIEPLLDALLAHVLVVDGGWERAADIALQHPNAVVVTRDGDRFSSAGWRVGAARSQLTVAALDEARSRAGGSRGAGECRRGPCCREHTCLGVGATRVRGDRATARGQRLAAQRRRRRLGAGAGGAARGRDRGRGAADAPRRARGVGGRRAHPHYRARAGLAGSRGRRGSGCEQGSVHARGTGRDSTSGPGRSPRCAPISKFRPRVSTSAGRC